MRSSGEATRSRDPTVVARHDGRATRRDGPRRFRQGDAQPAVEAEQCEGQPPQGNVRDGEDAWHAERAY